MLAVGLSKTDLDPYLEQVNQERQGELIVACFNSPKNYHRLRRRSQGRCIEGTLRNRWRVCPEAQRRKRVPLRTHEAGS